MKRKKSLVSSDEDPLQVQESTPRKRRAVSNDTGKSPQLSTPSTRSRSRAKQSTANTLGESPTPKPKAKSSFFLTPSKNKRAQGVADDTPSQKNADRSAKRKSVGILLNPDEDDAWDGGERLARQIWDIDDESEGDGEENGIRGAEEEPEKKEGYLKEPSTTQRLSKQPRTRVRRRTPTPEGDLPAHEKYFFQNRPGPVLTSDNTLSKLTLLTHEEYFDHLEKHTDHNSENKKALSQIHERSFPQWNFELSEGFNICLHGYGSKRNLLHAFADWLYERYTEPPIIVVVNGYAANITLRSIFATIMGAAMGPEIPSKLGTQPSEVLDLLQSSLNAKPPKRPITILINSIDAIQLRRQSYQALLARLASLPHVNIIATADTPNFLLLWDSGLRDQFNFAFHDCTTFVPYDVEINVVDEVHSLLGRKVRRIGGKQGIGFVLKSLPENTRKLYRLLIIELLTLVGDQHILEDEGDEATGNHRDKAGKEPKEAVIEWRTLFHKATEEFISSSELMFRTQLKEFYDHQMVVSRTDASGVEMLGVPLSQEEMESILEDLVIEQ
ncbi:Origin recognition complex subunit 2 [Emydomyces testavorans]|uniref:Origin recognition complex subunit 2 n=1 Tax=Emydomyces testavorans TaxID=2070801 RepID=A0AAF0DDV4_9EURO|nr:Origin recognition complex subunit 2 [Emydomyces testavorans]